MAERRGLRVIVAGEGEGENEGTSHLRDVRTRTATKREEEG